MELFGPVPAKSHLEPGVIAGCFTLDRTGAIGQMSAELTPLFGYDLTELKGRPLLALFGRESRAQLSSRFERFFAGLAGEPSHLTVALAGATKHEGEIPLQISVHRTGSGQAAAFVAIVSAGTALRAGDPEGSLDGGEYRTLASRLLREEERRRRDLAKRAHDDFGQEVATAKLNLSLLRDRHPAADPSIQDRLDRIERSLSNAATAAQGLCDSLYPPELEAFGLPSALKALAKEVSEACGFDVGFVPSGKALDLPPDRAIFLYRIVPVPDR